jgi:Asp-tRNA(Asn)/Glu-tRNA(Gln) amidotransferase A subunit family amidase
MTASETSGDFARLGATAAVRRIAAGELSARVLADACLARIAAREPAVQAWQFLDPGLVRREAEIRDAAHAAGRPFGALHGVPVGIKDIFDTGDMPTEYGSPLYAGHRPRQDAAVVRRLRAAGAVIVGKTVTTEFAARHPGKTRNPHDPRRTPGGSSSGSAAAVADGMVPLALGSQTVGSTIRPGAYCGAVAYKPSFGLITRAGMCPQSRFLDHVGLFARSVEDIALLGQALAGHDPDDPDTRPFAAAGFAAAVQTRPAPAPRFAFVRTPYWDRAEPAMQAALATVVAGLGPAAVERNLPSDFARSWDTILAILESDMAHNLRREYARDRDRLSASLCALIESGQRRTAVEYLAAQAQARAYGAELDRLLSEVDAILTPATTGPAPVGLEATGDPIFCTLWTLCGLPAISLPLRPADGGMPLAIQLVGRRGSDAILLRTARWLHLRLGGESGPATSR